VSRFDLDRFVHLVDDFGELGKRFLLGPTLSSCVLDVVLKDESVVVGAEETHALRRLIGVARWLACCFDLDHLFHLVDGFGELGKRLPLGPALQLLCP